METVAAEITGPAVSAESCGAGVQSTASSTAASLTQGSGSLSSTASSSSSPVNKPVATTTAQTVLLKTKLTKEQREAQRIARDKERAEMRAKKEAEALQKEKERAELKAKKEAEMIKKEKERAELKAKKEAENLRKEQEKREKQQKREQEMKERKEKKEREDLEKKERKEKREAERKKREDEKRQKEESRKKKLEEKEQQIEEKMRREEQAKKKFLSFFTKCEKPVKKEPETVRSILTPFSVKDGMKLATPPRIPLQDTSALDSLLLDQDTSADYLSECKSVVKKKSRKELSPEPMEIDEDNDSCQIWEPEKCKEQKRKFKLIQFHENYRPAYYGTWSKSRGKICARNPFRKDMDLLDYTVDSDDEWEEEDPGESLSNSEGEDREAGGDGEEEDDDDGFFVPHGYLSNDEGDHSDSEGGMNLDDLSDPQDRKNSQLAKAKAWEAEFARKCQPLTMKIIGPMWPRPRASSSSPIAAASSQSCDEEFLSQFAAVSLVPLPIPHPMATKGEASSEPSSDCTIVPGSGSTAESLKQPVPEEAMPDLICFVHKNPMGMTKIIRLFRAHWGAKIRGTDQQELATDSNAMDVSVATNGVAGHKTNHAQGVMATTPKRAKAQTDFSTLEFASGISKRQLERKVQAIALKETRQSSGRSLYYVHAEILQEYGIDEANMVGLVSDPNSPLLVRADTVKPSSLVSPDVHGKQKKKVVPGNHQSLFHFLKSSKSSSPGGKKGDKNTSSSSNISLGKHEHSKENEGDGEVILVKVTPASDEKCVREPPAKKLHLDGSKCEPLADNSQPINA